MTIKEAYHLTRLKLREIYSEAEADAIALSLFDEVYKINKTQLILHPESAFEQEEHLYQSLQSLLEGKPLQHLIGYEYFGGLKINVNSNVLIPRPETEELLEWMMQNTTLRSGIVADICTGSGCIAIYMRNHSEAWKIYATDLSEEALATAKSSELEIFGNNKINWTQHNILNKSWEAVWPNLVICNPPYIGREESELMTTNVLQYEPHLALFVDDSDTLLFYKKVIEVFSKGQFPEIFFELNPLTVEGLRVYCNESGYQIQTGKDMHGKIRFARITR